MKRTLAPPNVGWSSGGPAEEKPDWRGVRADFRGVQKTSVFCTVTSGGVQKTDVFCTPPEPRVNWAFPPLLLRCSSGRAALGGSPGCYLSFSGVGPPGAFGC